MSKSQEQLLRSASAYLSVNVEESLLLDGNDTLGHREEALHQVVVGPRRRPPVGVDAARVPDAPVAVVAVLVLLAAADLVDGRVALIVDADGAVAQTRVLRWRTDTC